MFLSLELGSTSVTFRVKLIRTSTQQGFTGLTSASAGLIIASMADNESGATAYTQAAGNIESITTLGTWVAPTTNKIRFKEVDATNLKGIYEVQVANARMSVASAKRMIFSFSGVSDLDEQDLLIDFSTQVDVRNWKGATVIAPTVAGVPKVDVSYVVGVLTSSFTCPGGGTTGSTGVRVPTGGPILYQGDKLVTLGGATVEGASAIVDTVTAVGGGIYDITIVGTWNGVAPANGTLIRVERNSLRPVTVSDIWAYNTGAGRTLSGPTNLTSDNTVIGRESSITALAAAVATLNTAALAIKALTDGLPASTATQLAMIAGYVDTEVAAILAGLNALNNVSSAQVQAAALAALNSYDPPTRAEATADKNAVLAGIGGEAASGNLLATANTAHFVGSPLITAVVLSDAGVPITSFLDHDLEGREILITSGLQKYESRFIKNTVWDSVNNELRITLSRALPAAMANGDTAVIR